MTTADVLAQQIATNGVSAFAYRIHRRAQLTFDDTRIARAIETLLLELTPTTGEADEAPEVMALAPAQDVESSVVLAAVEAALSDEPLPSTDKAA